MLRVETAFLAINSRSRLLEFTSTLLYGYSFGTENGLVGLLVESDVGAAAEGWEKGEIFFFLAIWKRKKEIGR